MPKEATPSMSKVPDVRSDELAVLPDDHLLVALACLASSKRGLTRIHRRLIAEPSLAKFAPTLAKLQRSTRRLHTDDSAAARAEILRRTEMALVDLGELCTPEELWAGSMTPHVIANLGNDAAAATPAQRRREKRRDNAFWAKN